MKCISCENELENTARFCGNCGQAVVTETVDGVNVEQKNFSVWKCPKCETLNQGQTCVVCGEKEAISQDVKFCPDCGKQINNKIGYCENCKRNENGYGYVQAIQQNKKTRKNAIIALFIIILIICIMTGVFSYFVFGKKVKNREMPVSAPAKTENNSEKTKEKFGLAAVEEPKEEQVAEEEKAPKRIAVEDVETKVLTIRKWYNDTQNNFKNLSAVKAGTGITEYYDNVACVRIDVLADEKNNYNRQYYFKDNKLYFVFAFDGKKENRLYFYDERLFRWIDENGIIHDNDFSNKDFILWKKNILNELAFLR